MFPSEESLLPSNMRLKSKSLKSPNRQTLDRLFYRLFGFGEGVFEKCLAVNATLMNFRLQNGA
jgi:hypothetical protein